MTTPRTLSDDRSRGHFAVTGPVGRGTVLAPTAPGSFTVAVIPDTQYRVGTDPSGFGVQTRWLADHAERLNLAFVLHEGDLVLEATDAVQYRRAADAMATLTAAGIGWAVTAGNHDTHLYETPDGPATGTDLALWDQHFGPDALAGVPGYGGHDPAGTATWHTFDAGGQGYLVVALPFGPTLDQLDWARARIDEHPTREVVLLTHDYLGTDGRPRGGSDPALPSLPGQVTGEVVWDRLVRTARVAWVLNGHVAEALGMNVARRTVVNDLGTTVTAMLANYQGIPGEPGFLRLLTFYPAEGAVRVETVAPDGSTLTDPGNAFLVTPAHTGLPDVGAFATEIDEMVRLGVIDGYADGLFHPQDGVTRQAAAAFVHRARPGADRAATSCAPGTPAPFVDVPASHPFCHAISALAARGRITGHDDGTFRPTALVTRQAFAAFMFDRDGEVTATPFVDVGAGDPLARSVQSAAEAGVIRGYPDGTFRPAEAITREAAAAMVARYYYLLRQPTPPGTV